MTIKISNITICTAFLAVFVLLIVSGVLQPASAVIWLVSMGFSFMGTIFVLDLFLERTPNPWNLSGGGILLSFGCMLSFGMVEADLPAFTLLGIGNDTILLSGGVIFLLLGFALLVSVIERDCFGQ